MSDVSCLLSVGDVISACLILAVGAIFQGSVGFGTGLVAAPFLVLISPRLVPGPLIFCGVVLPLLILCRQRSSIHLKGLGWALAGRVPGACLGAMTLHLISPRLASLVLAAVILLAVAMSISGLQFRPGRWALLSAGTVSGYMATVTSIGGPPIALVYQDAPGDRLRGTLSGFFLIGSLISLLALVFSGQFHWEHLRLSLLILPGCILGFIISIRTAAILDRGWTRPAVLSASILGALVCVLRQFW